MDDAVTAHLEGNIDQAKEFFASANLDEIRVWTEELWGPGGKKYRVGPMSPKAIMSSAANDTLRMPNKAQRQELIDRDGYHCRFCGIPVIREEVRKLIRKYDCYQEAVPWGRTNRSQHAAFQAMWLHYDHIIPHSLGGPTSVQNMVISCAPCNCARMECTLAEVGLFNPLDREPVRTAWDGLERFRWL